MPFLVIPNFTYPWLGCEWTFQRGFGYAGKPHVIKEENFLLYGVVEEKAFKAKSQIITFDFWSVRRNVLQDRTFNAALILQNCWRAYRDRKRRQLRKNRSSINVTRAKTQGPQIQPQFYKRDIEGAEPEHGSGSDEETPAASSLNSPGLDAHLHSLVHAAAAAME